MPLLLDLPNEILYHIAGCLALESDLSRLARTNRHLYTTINPVVYRFNALYGQMSALLWAAERGMVPTAQYALEASVRVSGDKLGILYDALSQAVQEGHTRIAENILLQDGIDPNFQHQQRKGDGSRITFLARAAKTGHMDLVALFLSTKDINPNLGDDKGRPPITYAGFSRQDTVVKQLLATPGVDPDWRDDHGRTPLSWTVSFGSDDAVSQFLSRSDVDVNAPMATDYWWKKGWTTLMFASCRGFTEKVQLLLNQPNINVNHQCERGKSALHLAAKTGSEAIVQLLLAHGAYPDPKECYGRTPLYESARSGCLPIMNMLYTAGADPNTITEDGDTAVTVASRRGHTEIVRFLLKTGKINLTHQGNDDQRNALSWAAAHGYRGSQ
ncbi:ankyrin repeat-containing domain protein [Aspergillus bertholletiae]|uniref:Ankyrin repeat-containing domain protein n=1 Tax=Aspergillus bertholletiae TaxID=1226010 RepID=A0A5N7AN86_9EURO|nr:ankyrin repeat-containing domain protein [Aspergillus bertholletiae]